MPQQLVITLEDNGQVNVSGPIGNKVAAYGLLEIARDAINEFHNQNEKRVQPAGPQDLALVQGN